MIDHIENNPVPIKTLCSYLKIFEDISMGIPTKVEIFDDIENEVIFNE